MAMSERPYLDKPEILEYPTETWAAQDMRKCDVFLFAARHAPGATDAQHFRERAAFFHEAALSHLYRFESRTLARPRVLLLSYGFMFATADALPVAVAGDVSLALTEFPPTQSFRPQKEIAFARAKQIALGLAAGILIVGGALLLTLI
jgi:hypothetical protein